MPDPTPEPSPEQRHYVHPGSAGMLETTPAVWPEPSTAAPDDLRALVERWEREAAAVRLRRAPRDARFAVAAIYEVCADGLAAALDAREANR